MKIKKLKLERNKNKMSQEEYILHLAISGDFE